MDKKTEEKIPVWLVMALFLAVVSLLRSAGPSMREFSVGIGKEIGDFIFHHQN